MLKKFVFMVLLFVVCSVLTGCTETTTVDITEPRVYETVQVNNREFKIYRSDNLINIDDKIIISKGTYYELNVTLVIDGNEATMIDTGKYRDEVDRLVDYMNDHNIELKTIIITHDHHDHIENVDYLVDLYDDVGIIDFNDTVNNQVVTMGGTEFKIIHTPGHFDDYHQSVVVDGHILVAGDVIEVGINTWSITVENLQKLINTLNMLNQTDYSFIIPGHGDLGIGNDILETNKAEYEEGYDMRT